MAKQLGPTFSDEIIAAGLGGLPFAWGATDDDITGRDALTDTQNTTLDGVIAAHDPTKPYVPPPPPENVALFNHENRLRSMEGTPPLTLGDFLTKMKAGTL